MTEKIDRLAEHEQAYYAYLTAQADRLPELQQQQQKISAEITKIAAGRQQYMEFLMQQHNLQQGDRIERDGTIFRRPSFRDFTPSDPVDPPPPPEHPAEVWRREHPEEAAEQMAAAQQVTNGQRV